MEIDLGKHDARFDVDARILHVRLKDEFTPADYHSMREAYPQLFQAAGGEKFDIMFVVETNPIELSQETRNVIKEKGGLNKKYVNRIAIVGVSASMRMIAKILVRFSGTKRYGFFKTEEQAIAWCQKD